MHDLFLIRSSLNLHDTGRIQNRTKICTIPPNIQIEPCKFWSTVPNSSPSPNRANLDTVPNSPFSRPSCANLGLVQTQCLGTGTRYKVVHTHSQTLQCPGTTSRGSARSWAPCLGFPLGYGVQTSARALGTGTQSERALRYGYEFDRYRVNEAVRMHW